MKFLMTAAVLGFMVAAPTTEVVAKDAKGHYTAIDLRHCGDYIKAYSKTRLKGSSYDGPVEAIIEFEWISGWLSAYNALVANGKPDIRQGMSENDVLRWVASWCRDNPKAHLDKALFSYVKAQSNN